MSRPITAKDIANAAMGRSAIKHLVVQRMPPARPTQCAGCPFSPAASAFVALKCAVLKDELRAKPNAVWMCHETADGGARPTEKSILCKGAVDWRVDAAAASSLSVGTLSTEETEYAIGVVRQKIAAGNALRWAVVQAIDAHYGFTYELSAFPAQHRQEYDDLEAGFQALGYG
jgi:hypothetical protein